VLVNAAAERDEAGAVTLVRVAVFDATHRRAYERELLAAKQRAEDSEASARTLARTLQQTLIPPIPPEIPHLDVAAEYRPAGDGTQVGGDFYDVFQVGATDWVITVGDVCGKGSEAAVVSALARHTLRAGAMQFPNPAGALRLLNDLMREYAVSRYCTICTLRLHQDGDGWTGLVSSGGHPLTLLRTAGGTVFQVGTPGTLLGALDQVVLHDAEVRLGPGDTLLLYTDGLTEGRHGGEFYGDERLGELLARPVRSAAALVGALLADALDFQGGNPRDDIALLALHCPTTP
jgi:sigma-B regulation protein RsbU (phosphoserine phosphatase)